MKRKRTIYKKVDSDTDNLILNVEFDNENNKLELLSEAEISDSFDLSDESSDSLNTAMAALGLNEKQDDLMYIKFKLVHVGVNKNKDEFLSAELRASERTPILKLLNWGHKEPSIGVIYRSVYRDGSNGENDYLECYAAISKFRYRAQAEEIQSRYNSKKLYFSMETRFKEAECSICHGVFEDEEEYCLHLKNRFKSFGSVSRILHVLNFAGAAVVANPADINAEALALASEVCVTDSDEKEDVVVLVKASELTVETTEVVDNKPETVADIVEQVETVVEPAKDGETVTEEIKATVEPDNVGVSNIETIESIKKELENTRLLLDSISEKYNTLETEKNGVVDRLNTIVAEFENYKSEITANELVVTRANELNEIGYNFPDSEDEKSVLVAKLKLMDDSTFVILKSLIESNKAKASVEKIDASVVDGSEIDIPITSTSDTSDKDNHLLAIKQTIQNILA